MKKLTHALITAGILAGSLIGFNTPAHASTDKVTICHATGADGKYVQQTISKDGTANGHAGTTHQDGRDIIPAYSWIDNGVRYYFDGQNLEKGADILANGCQVPALPTTAVPAPPVYVPATCASPDLPYGRVIVPADLGAGVSSATTPALNADSTAWSLAYTLTAPTEETVYTWPAGTDGRYNFQVVPLTSDPLYVIDSRTGVGACELSDTGMGAWMIPATVLGAAAIIAGVLMSRRRRTA